MMTLTELVEYSDSHRKKLDEAEAMGIDISKLLNPNLDEVQRSYRMELLKMNIDWNEEDYPNGFIYGNYNNLLKVGRDKHKSPDKYLCPYVEKLGTNFTAEQLEDVNYLKLLSISKGIPLEVDEDVILDEYIPDEKKSRYEQRGIADLVKFSILHPEIVDIGIRKTDIQTSKDGRKLVEEINLKLIDFFMDGLDTKPFADYIFEKLNSQNIKYIKSIVNIAFTEVRYIGKLDVVMDDRYDNVKKQNIIQTHYRTGIDVRLISEEFKGINQHKLTKEEMKEYRRLSNEFRQTRLQSIENNKVSGLVQ